MFQHFDDGARTCVVRTQEETRRLGHAEIGAEHLLLGIASVDEASRRDVDRNAAGGDDAT